MDKKFIASEKESLTANIGLMSERLNFLIKNADFTNHNEKLLLSDLLNEYARNIETETKNYTYLLWWQTKVYYKIAQIFWYFDKTLTICKSLLIIVYTIR